MIELLVAEKRGEKVDVQYIVKPTDTDSLIKRMEGEGFNCYLYQFKNDDELVKFLKEDIEMIKRSENTHKVIK
jgi:hypothetical protein